MRLLCLLFCLFLLQGTAQATGDELDFSAATATALRERPRSYRPLNDLLRPYRSDSLLMKRFIAACEKAGYPDGAAYAFNQLGIAARNRSDFSQAVRYHQQGLEAALQADNLEFRIFSLNMLGVVYRRNDAVKTALDYNQEALALAESVRDPGVAIKRSINVALNSIGNIYQTLEQYELALKHYRRSIVLEEELGNTLGLAVNHQNIGECLEAQGQWKAALEHYESALGYDRQIGSDRGVAICQNSIARLWIKQGQPERSLPLLEQAWQLAQPTQDRHITTAILINKGWALTELECYAEARAALEESLDTARRYNLPSLQADALRRLSVLFERTAAYQAALLAFQEATALEEQVSNAQNLSYVNDMIIRYDTEKKNDQIQMLAQENEIVKLRLRRNQNALLAGLLVLALFTLILYILYRQFQLKSDKKLLTLEQSMLRSQMNPHFLFNSLNSIKLFIINNEKKNAVHYLNKFSKLVRKILEASSLREITLEEELETVALYMNIENIRFNHEIHFEITVENDIDPQQVRVPSLILQPFLENAVWHGLSAKQGAKRVDLHVFRENASYIQIAVTDNGIGRAAARKLKAGRTIKRRSMGIDITKERLANFTKDLQHHFELEFVDLEQDGGGSGGTRVILHIPIL